MMNHRCVNNGTLLDQRFTNLALESRKVGYDPTLFGYTDISRDGMLTGPNLDAVKEMAEALRIPLVASGGVSSLGDIRAVLGLEKYGVEGIIVGKALYTGAVSLVQAIDMTRGSRREC